MHDRKTLRRWWTVEDFEALHRALAKARARGLRLGAAPAALQALRRSFSFRHFWQSLEAGLGGKSLTATELNLPGCRDRSSRSSCKWRCGCRHLPAWTVESSRVPFHRRISSSRLQELIRFQMF